MATISGRVVFDRDRSATINGGDTGLANVPVVLQNTATNVRLVVLTDANGNYSFVNVPNGDYRIVESYGTTGGVSTPGNFNNATIGPVPPGEDPPISFATNPPTGATNLDSLTPDTLFVTVSGEDITEQDFLDGPVIYTPIESILDQCTSVSNTNLINVADNGTFGSFPPGTPANTGAPVEPYPGVTPDFTYVLPDPSTYTPTDGEYTVQNIMNDAYSNTIGAWWRIADHTTGNETGRMMVVNGFNPGAVFFRDIVTVQPNTNYLFSSWILNLFKVTGYPNPELGVRILDQSGNVIYSTTLGNQIPVNTNAPEWKEIGTVINSQNNTNLTVEFLSEGPAVIGNDYAIDDISLREIQVPEFIPVKTVSTPVANVGQVVTYKVTLTNTCTSPLTNVFFQDLVPNGLSFVPGTVTVNGTTVSAADPNAGFTVPDIPGNSSTTITFDAKVDTIPVPNPALNTATIDYSYTPVEGGIANNYTVISNTVPLNVAASADIAIMKTAVPNTVSPGEMLTYTIDAFNFGPSDAQNVVLTDTVPPGLIGAEYSTDGGITWNPWPGSLNLGTLASGELRTILIRGIVNPSAEGALINTANITSTTPDTNPDNNTSTVITDIIALADVSVVKTSSSNPVSPGQMLVYEVKVSNAGPSDAQNVVLTDAVPPELLGAEYSVDNGITWIPWTGEYIIGTLPTGVSTTVLIRGTVNPSATGPITNIANVTSTTPDPNPSNNTSTITTDVSPSADVSIIKDSVPNPVAPGQMIVYPIQITNAGPSDAQNVLLMDAIPPEIIGAEFSTDGGATWNPWTGNYTIGTLPSGASTTILIRGTVNSSVTGPITNTANVTSTTPDPNPDNNSSTITTEVNAQADVSIIKTSTPNPVAPGDMLFYQLQVSNAGPADAQNVVVTDTVPPELSGAEFSTDGGVTWNTWNGTLTIGTLPSGDSRTIFIRGTVNQNTTGSITNTANVTSSTPDPNPNNNTSTTVTNVVPTESADISVTKSAIPNPVAPGQTLTYTITVSNAGPSDAQNVVLTDNIPPEILNPEYSTDGGLTWNTWNGTLDIGTLPNGASRTILIRGTAASFTGGEIFNTAEVTSTTPDPDLCNNTFTAITTVEAAESADVSVVKSASPNPVSPGQVLTYRIIVSNAGPSDAENVVLTDAVPSGITGAEFSTDGGITWNPWTGSYTIGTLPAGSSRTILIRGTVSSSCKGSITNTATVTSTTPDPNQNNNTSTVITKVKPTESADVSVTKSVIPSPVMQGQTIIYSIVVSNAGPSDAQNVVLTDVIPSSIIGAEFSTDGGAIWNPWTGSYTIGTLPSRTSKAILIRGTVSPSAKGTISNTAKITSTTPDPDLCNNTSTVEVNVCKCKKKWFPCKKKDYKHCEKSSAYTITKSQSEDW
jgi:uncharacterized repeat protein (TIGR01451 family)